ncbi:hypothetical protein [Chromobacterium subtsugae]|uniref:hypothetical protein n=1 Tax=Chromobacterium subtsugae TaxID=251747 RepID=UPI0015E7A701|nr:hypothetical protein [Chromobacterium subtsugae]
MAEVDDDCHVASEANVREPLGCANVSLRGRPRSSLRGDGRADIVWWVAPEAGGHGVLKSIIEVKNDLAEPGGPLEQDVGRLRDSLALSMKSNGELEFCCLAFWLGVGEPRRKIHDSPVAWLKFKSDRLLSAAQSSVARDSLVARLAQPKFYQGEYAGGASYAWAPGVLVIEKPAV